MGRFRFKYITYYGLWDCDELYDLQADPGEAVNLIGRPEQQATVRKMEDRLYAMLGEKGGLFIPLNPPSGGSMNKRLESHDGRKAADSPSALVAPAPLNKGAK